MTTQPIQILADYTLAPTTIELKRPSLGKSPSGFPKIHVELLPQDLVHLIGYDPRAIQESSRKRKKTDSLPMNVAHSVVVLHQNVQRSIDQSRVDAMVDYLVNALTNEQFADWSEIDIVTNAIPDMSSYEKDHVIRMPSSANYFVTDGQHRFTALLDFMQKYPELAQRFTQAVSISVLPPDRMFEFAGQAVHDKNYLHAPVKVAKALSADTRDAHNRLAKELHEHPVIKEAGGVNYTRDTLPPDSREFTTHSVLYKFVRGFVEGRKGLDRGTIDNPFLQANFEAIKADLFEYVNSLAGCFPSWKTYPGREKFLSRSSAAMQALGVLGRDLYFYIEDANVRQAALAKVSEKKLNWLKTNTEVWESVIGTINKKGQISPASSHQAVDSTIKFLRDKSGLSIKIKAQQEAEKEADLT
jgi:hypothetical protein